MKKLLRTTATIASFATLVMGMLHFFRVRTPRQVLLRTLKSTSQALSPLLVVLGVARACTSALVGTTASALAGLAGALLSARYVTRVIHAESRISPNPPLPTARPARGTPPEGIQRVRSYLGLYRSSRKPRWQRDIPYWEDPQTGQALRCDLWLPPAGAPPSGLALLYLHGGGFFTSEKDFGTRSFFRYLARQGHTIMDVNYRLAPEVDLFHMQTDVRRAIAWLKEQSADLGVDPRRIVLAGGSAGGLLALLVAYTQDDPSLFPEDLRRADLQVRGVVSYYGVVDLPGLAQKFLDILPAFPQNHHRMPNLLYHPAAAPGIRAAAWLKGVDHETMRRYLIENAILLEMGPRQALESLVGGLPAEIPERYRRLSPISFAGPGCPPTFLAHGAHDHLLPVEPTRALYRRLAESGVPAVFLELPETEHTFDLFLPEVSPPAYKALEALERFLACL